MNRRVLQGEKLALKVWHNWNRGAPFASDGDLSEIKIAFELFNHEAFRQFLLAGKVNYPVALCCGLNDRGGGSCPLQQYAASRGEEFGFKRVWVAADYAYYLMKADSVTWSIIPGWAGQFIRLFDRMTFGDRIAAPKNLEPLLDEAIDDSIMYEEIP